MSGVFQNIDPSPPGKCVPPRLWCGGTTHSLGGEGIGVNILEDARHCSVLYIRKCFVLYSILTAGVESIGHRDYQPQYTVKKVNDFQVPKRDVTNQTLPGRE
jgi:hypothetical protein